jgi:hypothetical protein
MAINKQVKIGGSYYKGYKLVVGAGVGSYQLDMTFPTSCVVNGITVIPDAYGTGDYFKIEHLDVNGVLIRTIAENIYNVGANAAWLFDLIALERMNPGDKFYLTYQNVAGVALNVYTNVERIR